MPITFNGNGTQSGAIFNRPAFLVYRAVDQSISGSTFTVVQFDTKTIDTDNSYDLSTHKFTPNVAGTYWINCNTTLSTASTPNLEDGTTIIRKNGSEIIANAEIDPSNSLEMAVVSNQLSIIVQMNGTSDYLDVAINIDKQSSTAEIRGSSGKTYFCGYKLLF